MFIKNPSEEIFNIQQEYIERYGFHSFTDEDYEYPPEDVPVLIYDRYNTYVGSVYINDGIHQWDIPKCYKSCNIVGWKLIEPLEDLIEEPDKLFYKYF